MVFMFNPPVKPNNKSWDLMSELETAIIKNAISREKNLLIKVLRFIDVWFLMGIKKAI